MTVSPTRLAEIEAVIAAWQQQSIEQLVAGDLVPAFPLELTSEEVEALSHALHQRVEATFTEAFGGPEKYARHKLFQSALAGARQEADRSIAIVQGAVTEEGLRMALESYFPGGTTQPDVVNRLFDPMKNGPLSNFGAKVDVAFALGILGNSARGTLKRVAEIRNLFAHRLDIGSFDHDDIRRLTDKLTYLDAALDYREDGMVHLSHRSGKNEVVVKTGFRLEENPFVTSRGRFEQTCSFFQHHLRQIVPGSTEPDLHIGDA